MTDQIEDNSKVVYEIFQQPGGYWTYEFHLTQDLKPGMGKCYSLKAQLEANK